MRMRRERLSRSKVCREEGEENRWRRGWSGRQVSDRWVLRGERRMRMRRVRREEMTIGRSRTDSDPPDRQQHHLRHHHSELNSTIPMSLCCTPAARRRPLCENPYFLFNNNETNNRTVNLHFPESTWRVPEPQFFRETFSGFLFSCCH